MVPVLSKLDSPDYDKVPVKEIIDAVVNLPCFAVRAPLRFQLYFTLWGYVGRS